MKIRLLIVFILSVCTLLAVVTKMLISKNEFTAQSTVAHAESTDMMMYNDQLGSGFTNWSWDSAVSFDNTQYPHGGASAIAFTPNSYGGMYLHTDTSVTAQNYESLQLAIRASADNQKFAVVLYDDANQQIQSPTPLENFGGDVTKESYKQYAIPLTSLNPSEKPIKGVAIQEMSGLTQPTVFLDDIFFKAKPNLVLPTLTPSTIPTLSISTTPTPSTDPVTSTTSNIFADSLSTDFENWSWDSSVELENTSPIYSGTKSIRFSVINAWGALFLHRKTPLNTSSYTSLSFSLRATEANQKYSLVLRDENNVNLGNPLPLSQVGGDPVANLWKSYTVTLSTLSAANKQISSIIIQDASGHAQPPLYIDNLRLKGSITTSAASSISHTNPLYQVSSTNPFAAMSLYRKPNSEAQKSVDSLRAAGRAQDADQLMKIANNPTAVWAAHNDPFAMVKEYVTKAGESGSMAVVVSYNIPGRDCGLYSSGGADYSGYKTWITKLTDSIGSHKTAVILEPDALGLDCLQNDNTYSLLRYAVDTLTAKSNISVYVDSSSWVPVSTMTERLKKIGIDKAQGFALNTSGYHTTASMISHGNSLSAKLGGKHFVIDTSRNGNGPYDESQSEPWCNPPGRAIGKTPTSATGYANVDAFLWVKIPGESDGTCRGGPSAGEWWTDYALGLVK